ncbi:hypothetical protein BDZ89DRAFT_1067345 [Hymenopellis radicata]|nr:hypothetical protein BDZ89DRAFT_1067345 [Hymenopellis radicata]
MAMTSCTMCQQLTSTGTLKTPRKTREIKNNAVATQRTFAECRSGAPFNVNHF